MADIKPHTKKISNLTLNPGNNQVGVGLKKTVKKSKKRLGRGYGSGKGGHTSSRGQKGQKSRGKVGVIFEGYKVKKSLIKRLPLLRGKGKFLPKGKPVI